MARIILSEFNDMTESQREQYLRFPANLTRALLKTTGSTAGYLSLGASFPAGKILDKDREMIILRVGALSKSPYERMQHLPLAKKAGWTDSDICKIEQGISIGDREDAILKYVDECVHNVKVSDSTFAAAAKVFTETQITELTLLIGHYMMTARFLESLDVDLDENATSWDAMTMN